MRLELATWISLLGLAMTAQAQTTQRQYQLQKTGDAPPVLKLVDAPVRQPDEHEVLVRVHAVSLNRRDIYVKAGPLSRAPCEPNLVPLSDGAGEVVAIGPKVTRFKKGDRVAVHLLPAVAGGAARSPNTLRARSAAPSTACCRSTSRSTKTAWSRSRST